MSADVWIQVATDAHLYLSIMRALPFIGSSPRFEIVLNAMPAAELRIRLFARLLCNHEFDGCRVDIDTVPG